MPSIHKPTFTHPSLSNRRNHILTPPLHTPLLLPNSSSEVRDLLASERTYLSNLRLALYLALVAGAITVQFNFDPDPSIANPPGVSPDDPTVPSKPSNPNNPSTPGDPTKPTPTGKREPSKHVAVALGAVFALASLTWMGMAVGNYARTVEGYARRRAIVQSGWKTQVVMGCGGVLVLGTSLFLVVWGAVGQ